MRLYPPGPSPGAILPGLPPGADRAPGDGLAEGTGRFGRERTFYERGPPWASTTRACQYLAAGIVFPEAGTRGEILVTQSPPDGREPVRPASLTE